MAKGPDFSGFGGYGPWPDNDVLDSEPDNPCPHYEDGYDVHGPGGTRIEAPTALWLDRMVYPRRVIAMTEAEENRSSHETREFAVSIGNITGKNPGPSRD